LLAALAEIAAGRQRSQARVAAAVNAARRRAWAGIQGPPRRDPGHPYRGQALEQLVCIGPGSHWWLRTLTSKAEPKYKRVRGHPLLAWCENADEALAGILAHVAGAAPLLIT
jgi:hypothetical protein